MSAIQKFYSTRREYPVQDVDELFTVHNTVYPNSMIRLDPRLPYMNAPVWSEGSVMSRRNNMDLRSSLPGGRANFSSTSIREFL